MVLFFDIGNVLLRFDPRRSVSELAWAVRRHPVRLAKFLWGGRLVDRIERGKLSPPELYDMFRLEFGYSGGYAAFRALWCGPFELIRPTARLFARLARRHRVYLLSNTNALHYEYVRRRYAFVRQAHGAVLSYRLGLRKPEKAIYRAAQRAARAPAKRCLFIDDRAENVAGARAAGWRAIRYTTHELLVRELTALGLV